jgi:hypothetical protein
LIKFFKNYRDFDYDPAKPYMNEFYRMAQHFGWGVRGKRYKKARKEFRAAMILQFNDIYGVDSKDLNIWSNLFSTLEVSGVPQEAERCKKVGELSKDDTPHI